DFLAQFLAGCLRGEGWVVWTGPDGTGQLAAQWNQLVGQLAKTVLPLVAIFSLLAVVANVAQTGFLFLPRKLAPDFSRIEPLAGMARIVSPRGTAGLAWGIIKLAVVVAVAAASLYPRRHELVALGTLELPQIATEVWHICMATCLKIGLALLVLALADYG